MDDLQSILAKVLGKRGLKKEAYSSRAVHLAQEYMNAHIPMPNGLQAVMVKDGALILETEHSIAAQEAQAVSEGLLSYLQREMPEAKVERIHLRRGMGKQAP